MERLFTEIVEQGWSARSREEFVRRYDRQIGTMIVDLLVEHGIDRRALRRSYIESRLRDRRAGPEHPLWEILEEVYMRVYREIFAKKLIENYVKGSRTGAVQTDFGGYLRGAVRRRFLDVLGAGDLSEKELLDAIVDSKKPQTQKHYIAEAKGRFGDKVRGYLLGALSSEYQRSLRALTGYFFERFVVENYAALRAELKPGDSVLLKLLEAFIQKYGRAPGAEITYYVEQVAPSLPRARRWAALRSDSESESEGEEEKLERAGAVARAKDPAQGERLHWWDRLLRCRMANEHELLDLQRWLALLEGDAQRDTKLCLACVQLKSESGEEQRDDLRMFLVYYLSNYGAASPRPSPWQGEGAASLTREALSLEKIRGQELSWEQIFTIFGRECNPSRIKNKIREKFEEGGR